MSPSKVRGCLPKTLVMESFPKGGGVSVAAVGDLMLLLVSIDSASETQRIDVVIVGEVWRRGEESVQWVFMRGEETVASTKVVEEVVGVNFSSIISSSSKIVSRQEGNSKSFGLGAKLRTSS